MARTSPRPAQTPWQLAEAKNRFSEVFTRAIEEGPQFVTRRNQEVVILSREEFERLRSEKPERSFLEHLRSMPKGEDLDLTRQPSYPRDIEW